MTRYVKWEAGDHSMEMEDAVLEVISESDSMYYMQMHMAKLLAKLHEQGVLDDEWMRKYIPWRYDVEKLE